MTTTHACKYCGTELGTESEGKFDTCRSCYFDGAYYLRTIPSIFEALKKVNANTSVWHSGGGNFHILLPIGERDADELQPTYILINEAHQMPEDAERHAGEWFPDDLPETITEATRWWACYFDESIDDAEGTSQACAQPLTEAELVRWCDAVTALMAVRREWPALAADARKRGGVFAWAEGTGWDGKIASLHDICDANEYFLTAMERGGLEEVALVEELVEKLEQEVDQPMTIR